jgi:hypothetical protein
VFRPLLGRGRLDFCPFTHKVCEDLRLDRLSGTKLDLKLSKLDRPLDDAAVGVAVSDDLSQGEQRRDHDLVSLEVVSKLSRRDQERIEQLLRLCVTCFSIGQNLAYVIYRS